LALISEAGRACTQENVMDMQLNPAQQAAQDEFRAFVDQWVAPFADEYDRQQEMPAELIRRIAEKGYLGGIISKQYGGAGMDPVTWGLLCEEMGRGSASLLSLFTVHGMVAQAIIKWGTDAQRDKWLPKLASGELIGAFGLTEPNVGSDAASIETTATPDGEGWILNGRKRWISFGQVATLLLIFAQQEGKAGAFLVERGTPGFATGAITGMLGFRSAMIADVFLDNCRIPGDQLVGRMGFGFSHIAGAALDHGRFCVGWGCLGMAQAALEASLAYAGKRKQFGGFLKGHQMIQELLANMFTQIRAARALCYRAAWLKQQGDPSLIMETSIAKYFASRMVVQVASDAVQIHGANGCHDSYPVARYLRDAKIMEIIEGSNQMQQVIISKYGYQDYIMSQRRTRQSKSEVVAEAVVQGVVQGAGE
jgi:glutaryl-CoA dehydrogenase (non-decarboxylating)